MRSRASGGSPPGRRARRPACRAPQAPRRVRTEVRRYGPRQNILGSAIGGHPNRDPRRFRPFRGAAGLPSAAVDTRGTPAARCVLSGDVADSAGHLVWIDCEMTGLSLERDKLIEVAVLVTDSELNVLDPGLDLIIGADDAALEGMDDVVQEMHAKSGLTEEVRAATRTVAEAEQELLA